ncbi:MAG: M1 family peptidase, partial [Flavobacterium sp.]
WIHEAFTMYSEVVYIECRYGYEKGQVYLNGLKRNVENDKPIIGSYGVNNKGSDDMYYKGALMLNTIRHIINNDKKWWEILLKYSNTFRHQIIDTETVITFFNKEIGIDLTPVFNQYLRYTGIPKLEYKISKNRLEYRWIASAENFNMPVDILINGKKIRLTPATSWTKSNFTVYNPDEIKIPATDFYIKVN